MSSSHQPIICVPKRSHQICLRTHRVCLQPPRPATGVSRALRARRVPGVSLRVSLGLFGPRAPECPKSVPRVSPECQKGVPDTPGTLSGHFLDTPEPRLVADRGGCKRLPQNSVSSLFQNSALETVFRYRFLILKCSHSPDASRSLFLCGSQEKTPWVDSAHAKRVVLSKITWWTFRIFFIFFCSGRGKGESEAPGGEGG